MNTYFGTEQIVAWLITAREALLAQVLVPENLFQIALQVAVLMATRLAGAVSGRWLRQYLRQRINAASIRQKVISSMTAALMAQLPMILSICFLWLSIGPVT